MQDECDCQHELHWSSFLSRLPISWDLKTTKQDKYVMVWYATACIAYDPTAAYFSWCTIGMLHQYLIASSNTQAMAGTLAGLLLASIAHNVTFADSLFSVKHAALLALRKQ